MRDSTYRLVYAGLGLVLVAVVALTVAFGPSGDETGLPEPIERVFPLPNGAVIRQAVVDTELCPRSLLTSNSDPPAMSNWLANVCRNPCSPPSTR